MRKLEQGLFGSLLVEAVKLILLQKKCLLLKEPPKIILILVQWLGAWHAPLLLALKGIGL